MSQPAPSDNVNLHYFTIKVLDRNRNIVEFKEWKDLYFHTLCNWRWYFDYRAALLKVKYPKFAVDCYWGHYPSHGPQLTDQLKHRVRAKKAKITEINNKIQAVREEWDEIFPLEEDPTYQKVMVKLSRLKFELIELELEFENSKKQ